MKITVEPGDPHHPEAAALLQASHALMQSLYPAESNHFLALDDLNAENITFLTATCDGRIIGTGALANQGNYGEVKSMFVDPDARGSGAARALLDGLEKAAREQGLTTLRLETGPDLTAAVRLYTYSGFTPRGPFGDYKPDPLSLFMEKTLT